MNPSDWVIHCLWFLFGAATMLVLVIGIAPVMLSSRISQQLEQMEGQYGQGDADVAVDAGVGGDGAGAAGSKQLRQAEE